MSALVQGRAFTWLILALYTMRGLTYAWGGHWGRALYWAFAAGITVSAEFLITRWP